MVTSNQSQDHSAQNPIARNFPPESELLYRECTEFQLCEFRRHPLYGTQLFLDGDLQISAVDSAYNTAVVAPLLGIFPLERVAILGGGDGGVLGEILFTTEVSRGISPHITLIDIDGTVVRECASRLSEFNRGALLSKRERVTLLIDDAFAFIEPIVGDLDAVVYDLTMDPVRDNQTREEFVDEIIKWMAQSLRSGGVLSMQCGPSAAVHDTSNSDALLLAEIHRSANAHFSKVEYQDVFVPSYEETWRFLSAQKE